MKQRTLRSKASSLLLSLAMVVASLPQFSTSVLAADTTNELPTVEQFATVDELKKFNTDDTNDGTKNPAKVYFGANPDNQATQQWWIAGSQNGNLTLFAASPLAIGVQFNLNYGDRNYNGQTVYPNHYGASDIRNTTLKGIETNTNYFSAFEKELMSDTEVTTDDTTNGGFYETVNKLYLAYGEEQSEYITVGSGLNDGLRVDKDYWGSQDDDFWLRSPDSYERINALLASPGNIVVSNKVVSNKIVAYRALVPAFELNLSSFIFASAALSATNVKADGTLKVKTVNDKDVEGAFTLRYDASKNNVNLGSALVSYDKSNVTLTDIPTDKDVYLVAQNKDGAKAKQITNETTVSASDMNLDSFENCKVWLETTDTTNRITYATLATVLDKPLLVLGGNEGQDYTYENGILTFINDGDYSVIGDGAVTSDRIIVNDNITGSLTLRNVNIITQRDSCLEVKGTANITIWLEGENFLKIKEHDPAALQFENVTTGSLIIDSKSNGKLIAEGWNGAGIGGSMDGAPKNLTFRGGIIEATSQRSPNGIGKGWFSNQDSQITVEGGVISSKSVWEQNKGLGGTENSLITVKGGYVDCGITGNAIIAGGYVAGEITGKVKNNKDLTLTKVDIALETNDVAEIWIDGENQNIKHIFNNNPIHLYLTYGTHEIKIVDSNGNEKTHTVVNKANGNEILEIPSSISTKYKDGLLLSEINIDVAGWVWEDGDLLLSVGTKLYPAIFDTSKLEDKYDFSNVDGYDEKTQRVTRNIEVKVEKGESTVTIKTQSLDKTFDNKPVNAPEYITSGSNGEVLVVWQQKLTTSKVEWVDLSSAPSNAGEYRVVVTVKEDNNYNSATENLEFVIRKTSLNQWEEELYIDSLTYGKTPSPRVKATYGDATFVYSTEENGIYTSEVPISTGVYYVKAKVDDTKNYNGLESNPVNFEIKKANPLLEEINGLIIGKGQSLSKIALPEGYKWNDETMLADELGMHTFKATYTPKDTENYNIVEVDLKVEVVPSPVALNHIPTINAKDRTLTVGDKFDALKDVVVSDADGDKVTLDVIKNTVDTNKVGTYEVTYKAMDSKGASITKTIVVKVIEAVEEKEELEDIINSTTSKYDKNDYTEESYQAYLDALEKVEEVLHDENATKQDIQAALDHLNDAIARLENKENEIPAIDDSNSNDEEDSVNTGDAMLMNVWTLVLVLSSIVLFVMVRRKHKYEK